MSARGWGDLSTDEQWTVLVSGCMLIIGLLVLVGLMAVVVWLWRQALA